MLNSSVLPAAAEAAGLAALVRTRRPELTRVSAVGWARRRGERDSSVEDDEMNEGRGVLGVLGSLG